MAITMKTKIIAKGGIAVLAAVSIALTACGGKKDSEGDKPKGGDKPAAPAGDTTPTPEPEPTPAPVPSAGDSAAADKLIGYWAISKDKMLEIAKKEAEANGGTLEGPEAAMAIKMVEMMAGSVVLQFSVGGKAIAHTPGGVEEAEYKVGATDAASGEFELTIDPPDEDPKTGKAKFDGDMLEMTVDDDTMFLERISEEEFEKRKSKIKDFDPSSLIPPGALDIAPEDPTPVPDVIEPAPAPAPAPPVSEPVPVPAPE